MGKTRPYFRDDRNLCHGSRASARTMDMGKTPETALAHVYEAFGRTQEEAIAKSRSQRKPESLWPAAHT